MKLSKIVYNIRKLGYDEISIDTDKLDLEEINPKIKTIMCDGKTYEINKDRPMCEEIVLNKKQQDKYDKLIGLIGSLSDSFRAEILISAVDELVDSFLEEVK